VTGQQGWLLAATTGTLVAAGGLALLVGAINAALIASRPLGHTIDGSCCGGGRR
jgi:hypothetical protein